MEKGIEIIYDLIISGFRIDRDFLMLYNITDNELNSFIEDGLLVEKNNCYIVGSVNDLYRYGIKLFLLGKPRKAKNCFSVCYKYDPSNREVCLQLMNIALKEKNYIGVSKLFEIIRGKNNDTNIEDNKLYGFLLGIIMDYREEYLECLRDTELEEMIITTDKEYANKNEYNTIIRYIYNQKYKVALKFINDLIAKNSVYTTELELLKEFISQVLLKDNKFKKNIGSAIENKDYDKVLKLLSLKSKNQYLTNKEMYIKLVCEAILNISATNKIPTITEHNTKILYNAIVGNNFRLALSLNEKYLEDIGQDAKKDLLCILLNDLVSLIDSLELKEAMDEKIRPEENIKGSLDEEIDISYEEELVYYIQKEDMTLDEARKKFGILPEQLLLIKLIFARYYYNDGTIDSIDKADKIICEVENNFLITERVSKYLNELKESRDSYICVIKNKKVLKK